jgi:hypothetical protein
MRDCGPWLVHYWPKDEDYGGVFIASEDFTHDVCMEIRGDFANHEDRMAYAQELCDVLNGYREEP